MTTRFSRTCGLVWVALLGTSAGTTAAQTPALQLPLLCEIGPVCSIQNFFDHDAGPGFRDYHCGNLGYDGHDGTDIRLPSLAVMQQGVAVIAAAPGRVRAIRDGMPDISMRDLSPETIRGREAGNGVVLQHGDDWETQYSHMQKGSIRVKPGDEVRAGQLLGLVGLSGKTEFPHLHFEIRHRGKPVDPFVGLTRTAACGTGDAPLWDAATLRELAYQPTGLLQAGFAGEAPTSARIAAGDAGRERLGTDMPALVFWVEIYGAQAADEESLRLVGPGGEVLAEKTTTLPKDKARWFSYAGTKRRGDRWPEGSYLASYRLVRKKSGTASTVVAIEKRVELR